MSISRTQFCVNLLSEFFKPAGYLTPKSQLVSDANRPLLNVSINQGFRITDTGTVELELQGINSVPGRNLFTQDCFEFNCFQEEGLTEAYVNIGTDICLVQSTSDNPYMTPEQRQAAGLTCFVDGFNKRKYFVRGTQDVFGYVYVADIGVINPTSGFFTILNANVPFYSTNEPGSLFARSIRRLPVGIKAAIIKRVNVNSVETIGAVFGQLEEEFYFPHSTLRANRSYTYEGQQIKLEDLSINLLLMSSFKRFELKNNQIIYRNINYSSPEIENIVRNSGPTLLNLINTFISPQRGSVPKYITSYLKDQSQYNNIADPLYENLVTDCFEPNCFDVDCFEQIVNNSLIERTIDNRAIAWLVQFLVSFSINYNQTIDTSIVNVLDYLIRQKDPDTKLYYKGWDQIEEECVELATEDLFDIQTEDEADICLEGQDPDDSSIFYNQSLELNTEILTSTNVAIFMALLKGFELTQNFDYIVEADELYTSIKKYLVNDSNLLRHSTSIQDTSIESATYHLILSLITEEYESLTELISFFKARLFASPEPGLEPVQVGVDDVLVGTELVFITEQEEQDSDADNILFTLTEFDTITTSEDIFKYNYLAYSSFNYLNQKISIPFLSTIKSKYRIIEESIIENRGGTSLIFGIGCLIDNDSFLGFSNIRFNSLLDFNNFRFQKEVLFNNMLINTPKDYNWFNPEALRKGTHIGAILYSYAKVLARVNAEYEHIKRSLSIDELYGTLLNTKGEDYNLIRLEKESDIAFRNRIKNEIFNRGINKEQIANKLALFNSEVSIRDNFPAVLSFETADDDLFSTRWGMGYLQGGQTYNTNIVTLNFAQPVESDIYEEIQNVKPAGIKLEVVEVYTFNVAANIDGGTAVIFTDINGGCDNLDLETGDDILLETERRICLEDGDSVITSVTLPPVVLPPLDEPIITDDPNSCDCESLRGYITVDSTVTELRNLRTIPLTTLYDVNASNGDTEPCDLAIESVTTNNTLEYLEIAPVPIPLGLASTIIGAHDIVDSSFTQQLFTIGVSGGNSNFVYREGTGGDFSAPLQPGNYLDVKQTVNYLLVLARDTNILMSVNKTTMATTTVTFTPNGNGSDYRLVELDPTTIGIYNSSATDDTIHTYIWSEGSPITFAGSTVLIGETFRAIYFNTNSGLKRLTELTSSGIIFDTPGFDELGIVEQTLSTNVTADSVVHHNGKNYFSVFSPGVPFSGHVVYQNTGNIIRAHSNDTTFTDLQYGPPTFNSFSFETADRIVPLGNYFFIPGSNKAYSFSSDSLEFINNLRCPTDPFIIPSVFNVQAIGSSPAGVLVLAVNMIDGIWNRYLISVVNKEC